MQRLRHATFLARLVLAWFALALGVAVASPVVKPQGAQLVCSGAGAMQLVMPAGDVGQPPSTHTFDCPLCAAVAPPPPCPRAGPRTPPDVRPFHAGWAARGP